MVRFEDARRKVIEEAGRSKSARPTISRNISDCLGYVLAEEIRSDREYPPFDRSTRDGYAVRASEAGAEKILRCVGEIKAGDTVSEALAAGSCVQIMTGAAVPAGADAVVMIEFTARESEAVKFPRETKAGQNIVVRGSEASAGDLALTPGLRRTLESGAWLSRTL